jgi:type IV secretory pathway TrbD component
MKIPLYQSTTERIMIAGLPRNIAIIGGTLAAAIAHRSISVGILQKH